MTETVIIVLVVLGVIVVLLLFALIIVHGDRKDTRNARAALAFHQAASTITRVETELRVQIEAGYVDPQPLVDILAEYRQQTDRELR